jgi:hypothetical protein
MDLGRNHRFLNAPSEHPDKALGPLIHDTPTEAGINQRLPDGFELERPEIPDREGAEQLAERPDCETDVADFGRRFAVLAVVTIGEFEIGQR